MNTSFNAKSEVETLRQKLIDEKEREVVAESEIAPLKGRIQALEAGKKATEGTLRLSLINGLLRKIVEVQERIISSLRESGALQVRLAVAELRERSSSVGEGE